MWIAIELVAHMPWSMTPDGRNPRPVQGNYTPRPTGRPDMELDVRAIPGSQRLVATAAPHHGQAFGSLVVVDPRVRDDDRMSAVKRACARCRLSGKSGRQRVLWRGLAAQRRLRPARTTRCKWPRSTRPA